MKKVFQKRVFWKIAILFLIFGIFCVNPVSVNASGTLQEISFGEKYNVKNNSLYEVSSGDTRIAASFVVKKQGRVKIVLGYPSSSDRYTTIYLRKDGIYTPWVDVRPELGLEKISSGYITLMPGEYEVNITDIGLINDDMYLQIFYDEMGTYYGETESNDTFDTANEIRVNQSYTCDYSKDEDIDYFKFVLGYSGKVEICIENENYNSRIRLYKEDVYGNTDEIEINEWDAREGEDITKHNVQRLPAGTYYIKVVPSFLFEGSQCTFSVQYEQEKDGFEKEWNDYSENANVCLNDKWYTGNLSHSSDKDWYKVYLDKQSYFKIEFKVPRQIEEKIFSLKIYNQSLNYVYYETYNTSNPYICSNEMVLNPGVYYVCVNGYESYYKSTIPYVMSTYDYSIRIHHEPVLPFTDVSRTDWYYSSVVYAYENRLMSGLTNTLFGPSKTLNRAQFATILYRMNGSPYVSYKNRFSDVKNNLWYTEGVLWASDIGVVSGYGNGMFGPDDNVTREQMVSMMLRFAKYKKYDISLKSDFRYFADASKVSGYASEAIQWALANNIISGKHSTNGKLLLDPQGSANRAECAAIIMRFLNKY